MSDEEISTACCEVQNLRHDKWDNRKITLVCWCGGREFIIISLKQYVEDDTNSWSSLEAFGVKALRFITFLISFRSWSIQQTSIFMSSNFCETSPNSHAWVASPLSCPLHLISSSLTFALLGSPSLLTWLCPLPYPPFYLVCTRPLPTSLLSLFHSWTDWDGKSGIETCLDYWGHQYLQLKCACTCWSTAALPQGSTSQCQSEFIALHLLSIKTVKNCCLAFAEHASSSSKSNIPRALIQSRYTQTHMQRKLLSAHVNAVMLSCGTHTSEGRVALYSL